MVTIKTLAEKCGLSIAAVSKALNGKPGIGPEKAELVRQTARELGYYPNAAAQTLKTRRSHNIGILFKNSLGHEFFSLILESIRQAAENKGYDITFLSGNAEHIGYYEHAMRSQCDGVIIAQGSFHAESLRRLAESELPVVSIEQAFPGCTSIMGDNVGSMETIVRYLHGLGHDRLAYIHGPSGEITRSRLAGFYRGCRECGITAPDSFVTEAYFHEPGSAAEATRNILKEKIKPTCIIYPDDISCIGGMTALRGMGLSVPEDISCFGYDGIRLTSILSPSIATYHQNAQEIGRRAAEELISAIEDTKFYVPQAITVPGEIQPGDSVRDLRGVTASGPGTTAGKG